MRYVIAIWCNGSTKDFGSFSGGSSPPRVTKEDNCINRCTYGDKYKFF